MALATIHRPRSQRHERLGALLRISMLLAAFGWGGSPMGAALAAGVDEGFLAAMTLPAELAPAPERFGPQTLFEIIDGEADLYLKAGFIALETRQYLLDGNSTRWLDILAYRMKSHRSAFAAFSQRRAPEAVPAALTPFSYRYRDGLFFVHGPFYVEIRTADESTHMGDAARKLAEAFVAAHAVQAVPIPELALLPDDDRVPGSMVLQPAGALGFEGFDDLFTARYRLDSQEVAAFLRLCASREAAVQLAARYRAFLMTYDGVLQPEADGLPGSWLVRLMDRYTLVFTRGSALFGVQEAPNPQVAAKLARRLYERLGAGGG